MTIPFVKVQGTGNDFIFVLEEHVPEGLDRAQWVKKVCQRNFSVGADGVAFFSNPTGDKDNPLVVWSFYNDDGSNADMCGNAARCSIVFAEHLFGVQKMTLKTESGLVTTSLSPTPQISYAQAQFDVTPLKLTRPGQDEVHGFTVNTGVPHYVIPVGHLDELSPSQCLSIQCHPNFLPDETNVTLFDNSSSDLIPAKSFERGVRNFTKSCGTGALAVAAVIQHQSGMKQVAMEFPGGPLDVRFDSNGVHLLGPAEIVFLGTLNI